MYQRYAETQGWKITPMSDSAAEGGGYKECVLQARPRPSCLPPSCIFFDWLFFSWPPSWPPSFLFFSWLPSWLPSLRALVLAWRRPLSADGRATSGSCASRQSS